MILEEHGLAYKDALSFAKELDNLIGHFYLASMKGFIFVDSSCELEGELEANLTIDDLRNISDNIRVEKKEGKLERQLRGHVERLSSWGTESVEPKDIQCILSLYSDNSLPPFSVGFTVFHRIRESNGVFGEKRPVLYGGICYFGPHSVEDFNVNEFLDNEFKYAGWSTHT